MIGAMARGGDVLGELRYTQAATKAAEFIWTNLRGQKSGLSTLLHSHAGGEARIIAFLEDYAFLIKGYLELYEATFERVWLDRAIQLQQEQDERLWDEEDGGYFMSRAAPDVLVRTKTDYDGAEPSGNSIAAQNLFRLALLTEDAKYQARAEQLVRYGLSKVGNYPYAMPEMMAAAHWMVASPMQIVFAGQEIYDFKVEANVHYSPLSVQMLASQSVGEFSKSLPPVDGKPTAYVCHDFRCERPVTEVTELSALLKKK